MRDAHRLKILQQILRVRRLQTEQAQAESARARSRLERLQGEASAAAERLEADLSACRTAYASPRLDPFALSAWARAVADSEQAHALAETLAARGYTEARRQEATWRGALARESAASRQVKRGADRLRRQREDTDERRREDTPRPERRP